jgi:hypothetical protein
MNGSFNKNTMWDEKYGELRAGIRQQTFLRYRFFDTELWEHRDYEPADGPAKFLWGCHNYWMQYRYTMDSSMLHNLLPMLEGGINAMAAHLEIGPGDTLHIPTGVNWENWVGKDPTGLLAILDWSLSTAKRIGEMLDYDENKLAKWDSIQLHLADFPVGKYPTSYPDGQPGYLLGRNFYQLRQGNYHFGNLPLPYRHWTHLLMLFPLHTVTWDQIDKRGLMENSINYWSLFSSGLYDGKSTSGYAPCASICMYADMGKTEKISDLIHIFLYEQNKGHLAVHNVWPNTMYRETGPVMETPLFFAASLQELLLKSYNGVIKIFPAIPDDWKDAAFYRYRAEGGFLVSAKYHKGTTEFVQMKSLAGEDFVLEAKMESVEFAYLNDHTEIRKMDGNRYKIKMAKGDSLLIYNDRIASNFTIGPIKNQSGEKNSYGLNEVYLEKRKYFRDHVRKNK